MESKHIRIIVLDVFLSIITFGIFYLYVQACQIDAVNEMIGRNKYSWIKWAFLSFITFGLYHIYYEYIMAQDIANALKRPDSITPLACAMLTIFGFFIVADAIQQHDINSYFEREADV